MSVFGTSRRQSPSAVDRRRSLSGVPALNRGVELQRQDDGTLMVSVPIPRRKGLLARFQPPVTERRAKLDELGSFIVGRIDGKTTVLELVESFVAEYKTNRREAELSTAEFLRSLVRRNIVSIGLTDERR